MRTESRAIRGTVATRNRDTYVSGYSDRRNPGHMGRGHLGISSHTFSDSARALRNFDESISAAHRQK